MKCEFCGKEVKKLYQVRFSDDPEDYQGYILNVCSACVPKECADFINENEEEQNGKLSPTQ